MLDGWTKEVDISGYFVYIGMFEMAITPPLDLRVRPEDKVEGPFGVTVAFYFKGYNKRNQPVFEYT